MDLAFLLSFVPAALFRAVITASIIVLPVIVLILIIRQVLQDHMPARWMYVVWLLLPIRLLLPWTPDSSMSLYNFIHLPAVFESTTSTSTTTSPASNAASPDRSNDQPYTRSMSEVARDSLATTSLADNVDAAIATSTDSEFSNMNATALGHTTEPNAQQNQAVNRPQPSILLLILSWVWLIGTAIAAAILIRANVRFKRGLRHGTSLTANSHLHEQLDVCKQQMKIRRNMKLIITDYTASPALTGLFRPKLLLPANLLPSLGEQQLQHIMLHEPAHWKRRDLLVNALMHILLAIHWFNPMLWYAYARMRDDQELACDAHALSKLKPSESRDYALTIIQLLESWSTQRQFVNAAGMSGSRMLVRRRIMMIQSNRRFGLRRTMLGLAALVLLAGCSLTGAKVDKLDKVETDRTVHTASVDAMKSASIKAAHETNNRFIAPPDRVLSHQETIARYNGSLQLLATKDEVMVYGNVRIEEGRRTGLIYSYDSLTVEIDGKSHTYPWMVVDDSRIHPQVRLVQDDVDQDGVQELLIITTTSTQWQGEAARHQESIHIINPEDMSETVIPDPIEAVKNAVVSTVTRNDHITSISFEYAGTRYTQAMEYYSLADGVPTQVVDHLVFGNKVVYSIVNGIIQAGVSASLDEQQGGSLSGFLSVFATYGPVLGKPTIKLETTTDSEWERTPISYISLPIAGLTDPGSE